MKLDLTGADAAIGHSCACFNMASFPTHTGAAARQSVVGNGPEGISLLPPLPCEPASFRPSDVAGDIGST